MDTLLVLIISCILIFTLNAVVAITVLVKQFKVYFYIRNKCYTPVLAQVVDCTVDTSSWINEINRCIHRPVFSYRIGAKNYCVQSQIGYKDLPYNKGDYTAIFYDSDNPEKFCTFKELREQKRIYLTLFFIIFCIMMVVFGCLIWYGLVNGLISL